MLQHKRNEPRVAPSLLAVKDDGAMRADCFEDARGACLSDKHERAAESERAVAVIVGRADRCERAAVVELLQFELKARPDVSHRLANLRAIETFHCGSVPIRMRRGRWMSRDSDAALPMDL